MILIAGPTRTEPLMRQVAAELAQADRQATVVASEHPSLLDVPKLPHTTVLVPVLAHCAAAEMDAMPSLQGIVSPLLGYDWIDVDAATVRSIPVVNGEVRESRESMAEATIMLILALLYRLRDTETELRLGGEKVRGRRMLKGRTVGFVGYGGITREIIHRLQNWQVDILVHTRARPEQTGNISFVPSDHLVATSDVIVLMTMLDAETRQFLNRSRLDRTKRGVLIVNTARGGLVDEGALVQSIESGQVGAAALDVFDVEPLAADHPFRRLPNVVLTPHAVGHTSEMFEQIPRTAAANVLQLLQGRIPESCVNASALRHRS